MDDKRWAKGVELEMHGPGKYRVVSSTREAAECLLYRWPVEGGPAHLLARIACLAVLEGEMPPDHAREAFIAAAEESGIHVRKK